MPTPTRGSALITFFTVAWSENANRIEAVDKKALKREIMRELDFSEGASIISPMDEREFFPPLSDSSVSTTNRELASTLTTKVAA